MSEWTPRQERMAQSAIESLNEWLGDMPDPVEYGQPADSRLVLVCGPPRSGTTSLTQLLARRTGWSYPSNVGARLGARPDLAIALHRHVFGDRRPGSPLGDPDYGRTVGAQEPHEFGRAWPSPLREAYGRDAAMSAGDRDSAVLPSVTVAARLTGIGPAFVKGFHVMPILDELLGVLPQAFVLHTDRAHSDVERSVVGLMTKRGTSWAGPPPCEAHRPGPRDGLEERARLIVACAETRLEALHDRHATRVMRVELAEVESNIERVRDHVEASWRA